MSSKADQNAKAKQTREFAVHRMFEHVGRRTVVPAGVSGPEFQLEIAAQSSSRIFVELDWAADRKLD